MNITAKKQLKFFLGGRQLDAQQRLKRFVERERKIRKRREEPALVDNIEFSHSAFNLLEFIVSSSSNSSYSCLGRHLCKMDSVMKRQSLSSSDSTLLKVTMFALMWIQLEDRSQSFIQFLENVTKDDFDEHLECDYIFYQCNN